jgi:hypothetical protein
MHCGAQGVATAGGDDDRVTVHQARAIEGKARHQRTAVRGDGGARQKRRTCAGGEHLHWAHSA